MGAARRRHKKWTLRTAASAKWLTKRLTEGTHVGGLLAGRDYSRACRVLHFAPSLREYRHAQPHPARLHVVKHVDVIPAYAFSEHWNYIDAR
jgi:hypothetical protein